MGKIGTCSKCLFTKEIYAKQLCKSCYRKITEYALNKRYRETHRKLLCEKEKKRAYLHPEKIKESTKKYYQQNRDKLLLKRKTDYQHHHEQELAYGREYFKRNKQQVYLWKRTKYQTDVNYKLCNLIRNRMNKMLRTKKQDSTIGLLGTTIQHAREHLERQFTDGMSWENAGKWHIDHIIPCASFDLTDLEQQKKCFYYTNLQPLWGLDNLRKGAKF